MFGVGVSGILGDWVLYDVDGKNGEYCEMIWEVLEIMLCIWIEDEFWEYCGKYWNVNGIVLMFEGLMRCYIKLYQKFYLFIGVIGFSVGLEIFKFVGEWGYIFMSLDFNIEYVVIYWDVVEEGVLCSG